MYISRIILHNIRGFRELTLDLTISRNSRETSSKRKTATSRVPRKRTVIIGKNGTCKTTLLRCIAIGICDEKDASGLVAEDTGQLVAEGKKSASIEIQLSSGKRNAQPFMLRTLLESDNGQDVLKKKTQTRPISNDVGNLLVCGYGAGRSTEGPETFRTFRIIDSVHTLFQYQQELISTELTLRRLQDYLGTDAYARTMRGIKKALGLSPKARIELPKGGGVNVSGPEIGERLPLQGWADGYRMTFNWILDLYAWAMRADCVTPSGDIQGILLVDELEQHLHPSMQVDLLERLSELLPNLQVIATTHSPLVALGASPNEVVVLKREGEEVIKQEDVPDFSGYSAEDMLVDPALFDSGVYSPETNKKLARYRQLVSIPEKQRSPRQ